MKKTARVLFLLAGCIFPIFIGVLHTFAHFKYLVVPEVKQTLQAEISIFGEVQIMWDTWGIVSFMMGISFIVIGLLNLSILNQLEKNAKPPMTAILAMIVYILGVIYVGIEFGQARQLYGGLFGLTLLVICGALSMKK